MRVVSRTRATVSRADPESTEGDWLAEDDFVRGRSRGLGLPVIAVAVAFAEDVPLPPFGISSVGKSRGSGLARGTA
jgi:hypothetical protein